MFRNVSQLQSRAILGGMLAVAAARGEASVSEADRASVAAAYRYLLRGEGALDFASLARPRPADLAALLPDRTLAAEALHLMTVMAFVDGSLDRDKIAIVLAYAAALGIREQYLTEIAEAARGRVHEALLDMSRRNLESITGKPALSDDAMAWFLPYRGAGVDPGLTARYDALGRLPKGSFGRAYWEHYRANGYALPGEETALNEGFATPHDSAHVISGYDTSARGEILVSTFTAGMHRKYPMAGHILPVIFSWHLGIKINDVAGAASGALDPEEFWHAWARGEAVTVDLFAPDWDFWSCAEASVDALRRRYGVTPLSA
jgi:hypothetical protein